MRGTAHTVVIPGMFYFSLFLVSLTSSYRTTTWNDMRIRGEEARETATAMNVRDGTRCRCSWYVLFFSFSCFTNIFLSYYYMERHANKRRGGTGNGDSNECEGRH